MCKWMATAVLGLTLLVAPAGSEIYRWTDASGRVHFTEDLNQVPRSQRPAALEQSQQDLGGDRVNTFSTPTRERRSRAPVARTSRPRASGVGDRPVYRVRVERAGTAMLVGVRINNSLVVPFIVDTGATDVSLPRWAADQLGLQDSGRTREYVTANGIITEKVVMLDSVDLGGARVEDVPASISSTMDVGLLGLSYFNHFTYHVDAARGVLSLMPNDLAENGSIRGGRSQAQWRAEYSGLRHRLARVESELDRSNSNASSKLRKLEAEKQNLLNQLELLEAEADQARVPMAWRD